MLTIRLQRAGKKNKAEYRLVLAQKTTAAQKQVVEILGNYNPHTKALGIRNQDRLNYWIKEQHVELSATVQNLLITQKMIEGSKVHAFAIPKKEVVAEAPTEPAAAEEASEAPAAAETPAEVEAPAEAPAEVQAPEAAPEEPAAPVNPES